jgi:hypothetical protein
MQKFLCLGAKSVRIQESAVASQGIPIVIYGFLLLYTCSFVFPRLLTVLFLPFVVLWSPCHGDDYLGRPRAEPSAG